MAPLKDSPFSAGSDPVEVAIDPSGKFAYVANQVSHDLSTYSINRDGALKRVPGSPFRAGIESVWVAVDPTGQFVYVTSRFSHNITAYKIGEEGRLIPIPGSPFPAGTGPNSIAFTPQIKKNGSSEPK